MAENDGNGMADRKYSDDEDDGFEDAEEDIPIPSDMDFDTGIRECHVANGLFLNNKFTQAREMMQPWADRSMYHALGYSTIMYLQATMTFEPSDIQQAVAVVKSAMKVCRRYRKKTSMMASMSKKNYNDYTAEEVHAELCYAETLLERALLSFIEDENLISFVKGSLKIREGYNCYKECEKILERRDWKPEDHKEHFESGVKMGIGLFNLLISKLPRKILKLLEFVGFSGNFQKGHDYLEQGAMLTRSLRGPLCSLALLAFHTIASYVLGNAQGDIALSERLIEPCLELYPKGALFLFFKGRIEEIKGNIDTAIHRFEDSVESQSEWRQFHHLCFWEIMWCHSFNGDWLLAMKYAERLCKESKWSKSTYLYQKASFLMMCDDQTDETREHIDYLMREVPKKKQKLAGKSLPIEKFAIKKADKYFKQGNRLTLAAYEMMYTWNLFEIVGKNMKLLEPMLMTIEEHINKIVKEKSNYPDYHDDYCLALLLKGVCLRHRGQNMQAQQCFEEVVQLSRVVRDKQIVNDRYLVPYTYIELTLLHLSMGEVDKAVTTLQKSRTYKKYSLESRLHFRMHAAAAQIARTRGINPEISVDESSTSSNPGSPNGDEDDEYTHF